jgi:hypothetical protein
MFSGYNWIIEINYANKDLYCCVNLYDYITLTAYFLFDYFYIASYTTENLPVPIFFISLYNCSMLSPLKYFNKLNHYSAIYLFLK